MVNRINDPSNTDQDNVIIRKKVNGKFIWMNQRTKKPVTKFTTDMIFLNEDGSLDTKTTENNARGITPSASAPATSVKDAPSTSKENKPSQSTSRNESKGFMNAPAKEQTSTPKDPQNAPVEKTQRMTELDYERFSPPTQSSLMGLNDLDYNRFDQKGSTPAPANVPAMATGLPKETVVVAMGTNDYGNPQKAVAEFEKAVAAAQKAGYDVVAVSPNPNNPKTMDVANAITDAASKLGVQSVTPSTWAADGIHPTQESYKEIAEKYDGARVIGDSFAVGITNAQTNKNPGSYGKVGASSASIADKINTLSPTPALEQAQNASFMGRIQDMTGEPYTKKDGKEKRSELPTNNPRMLDTVTDSVKTVFGDNYGIRATSGGYSPEVQAAIDRGEKTRTGSTRHNDQKSLDWGVVNLTTGQLVDKNDPANAANFNTLAGEMSARGIKGVGFGPNYMDDNHFHTDTDKANVWGDKETYTGMPVAMREAIEAQRSTMPGVSNIVGAGTMHPTAIPTPRPDDAPGSMMAQGNTKNNMSLGIANVPNSTFGTPNSALDPLASNTTLPSGSLMSYDKIDKSKLGGFNPRDITPAQAASLGFIARDNEDMANIGFALAGELSPSQLAGLANGDPKAKQEFANMITSIENRAGSKNYESKGIKGVLDPSQYNSLMPGEKLANTQNNFSTYQEALMGAVQDYYNPEGTTKPSAWDITNYYNPEISNPDWGGKMQNASMVGDHKYGSLMGPYDNPIGSQFSSWREGLTGMIETGWNHTPSDSAMNPTRSETGGYSAQGMGMNSPSEGAGRFGGDGLGQPGQTSQSPGAPSTPSYNSPSEGGGRFGGQGLGSPAGQGASVGSNPNSPGAPSGGQNNSFSGYDSVGTPNNDNPGFGGPR